MHSIRTFILIFGFDNHLVFNYFMLGSFSYNKFLVLNSSFDSIVKINHKHNLDLFINPYAAGV